MAPQSSIPLAANILGTIGTICWCVNLMPQVWRNYRTKDTEGLPASMMLIWTISGVPFGVYAIVQKFSIAIVVQPQCFIVMCGISWAQCLVYGKKWRSWTATSLLLGLFLVFGAIEAGLILAIQPFYAQGIEWPVLTIGVIAFIMLIAGFVPIPFELLKRRGRVIGFDFLFLGIDWCGAFFSLMALVAQYEFDIMFGTMYALCCTIEMSVVASQLIWLFRTRGIRKRAKESGKTFDDFPEAVEWQQSGEIDIENMFLTLFKKNKSPATTPEKTSGNTFNSTVIITPSVVSDKQDVGTDNIV